jgi:hypothetical protein
MSLELDTLKAALTALTTVGVCMTIHVVFMFFVLRSQVAFRGLFPGARGLSLIAPTILIATGLMTFSSHLQVLIWAAVMWTFGNFEKLTDALYFSATTYTTLGSGKHTLEPPFRLLEPTEAANGMLAAGLNTAVLFALLSSMARKHSGFDEFFR